MASTRQKSIVLVDQKPVKPTVTGNSEAIKLLASGKTGSTSKNLLENPKKGMQPAGTICETCPGPNPTSTPPSPNLNGGTVLAPKAINTSSSTPPWEHNGGVLTAPTGDTGVLSSNGNGTFNLTAKDGSVGTIKFTQVNGNTYGTFSLDGQTSILLVNPNGTTSFVSGIPGGLPGAGLGPSQLVRSPDINLPVLQPTIAGNIANTISSVLGATTDVPAGNSTLKLDSANAPSNSNSVPVNASQTRTVDTSDTSTTTTSAQAGATGKGDQGLGLSVSDTQTINVNDPSKDGSVNKVTVNNGDTSATYQQTDNPQGKSSTEQASTKVGDVDVQATNTDSTGTGKTSKTDSLQVGSEGTDVTVSHGSTEGSKNSGSETNAVQASSGDNSVGVSDTKTQGPDKTRKGQVTPGAVTDNTTVSASANLGGGVGIQGSSSNQQGANAGVTYKTNIDDNTKLTISGQTPLGTPGSPTISGAVTLDKSWGNVGAAVSEGPKGPSVTAGVCVGACKPTK
jgi:hypothetical protein